MASSAPAVSTAASVANEFLRLSREETEYPPCDQFKLQKLLYYAHAWHLALCDQPLFEENIEAWTWGPVVRNIYIQFRRFRRRTIRTTARELRKAKGAPLDYDFVTPTVEDDRTRIFLRAVWDAHKRYTGIQLSNATHAAGEPWTVIKEIYGTLEQSPTIPNSLIADIFRKKISGRAAHDSHPG